MPPRPRRRAIFYFLLFFFLFFPLLSTPRRQATPSLSFLYFLYIRYPSRGLFGRCTLSIYFTSLFCSFLFFSSCISVRLYICLAVERFYELYTAATDSGFAQPSISFLYHSFLFMSFNSRRTETPRRSMTDPFTCYILDLLLSQHVCQPVPEGYDL